MSARWSLVGVALLWLGTAGVASAQPLAAPAGDPVAGGRLFQTRGCVECHGADLARVQQDRSLYALAAAMWNHFPAMAGRIRASTTSAPYFTSGEMRDLMAFLHATDQGPSSPAGDAERGRQLVAAKGCLECHSLSGPAGKHAGSLDNLKGLDSPWSVVAQMWNHSFLMALKTEGQGAGWQQLSTDEMADLVAFLRALMRAP